MGKLTVHHNGMVPIEKEILLDDTLSFTAKGVYAYLVAKLDNYDSIESIDEICVDEVSKSAFDELVNAKIIVVTKIDGQIDYAVR